MTTPDQLQSIIGQNAVDADGSKIGKVGQIYLDDRTGEPQWVTLSTGLFGTRESFAPLYGSQVRGDELVLAVSKDLVKDAPNVEDDGHLEESEVQSLFQHYQGHLGTSTYDSGDTYETGTYENERNAGVVGGTTGVEEDVTRTRGEADYAGTQGRDTSGPNTDDAMTRSEERLRVGTEKVEAGRARLRKYVVTENVTTTVPVSHEEVRVEREPITAENRDAALSGQSISEEEHEVVLHAERPVVEKETVPVERVRLTTETVTEQQEVTEQVRKEQIEQTGVEQTGRDETR